MRLTLPEFLTNFNVVFVFLPLLDSFESGPSKPQVDPFAARLSISKPKLPIPIRKGPLKLGSTSKISALRTPLGMSNFSPMFNHYYRILISLRMHST